MKNKLLLFFIFWSFTAGSVVSQVSQSPADSLTDAGIMRPIHLFQENIQWNTASSDLFTYWIDNGLYGFYGPQPNTFVDGIPIDANFFGWQNLNMLPIVGMQKSNNSLAPSVYKGTLSPAGFIDYKNPPVDTGFSTLTTFFAGNETGDPGPYVYDSLKTTPNIDRWGPDGELSLSYRKGNWYSKGVLVLRNHQQTDLASNARLHFTASLLGTNQRYVNHRIYSTSRAALLETGYKTDRWGFRGRTTYGLSKDYIFLQPFGREIPAQTDYRQIAFEGYYKTDAWEFNGRYTGHQKTIDKRLDLHTYIFDWDQRTHTLALSANYTPSQSAFSLKPGITYERLNTYIPGLNGNSNDLATFSLDASFKINNNSILKTHLNADYDEEETARTYQFSFPSEINEFWKITPEILYTEVLPIRQHSFSYWVNRGYSFAQELSIPYTSSNIVEKNKLTAFTLRNEFTITSNIILTLQQKLISHSSLNIPFQQVQEQQMVTDTEPGMFSIFQEEGSRLGIFSKISHSFLGIFEHSIALNLQRTLSGSEQYENYFNQFSDSKINYQLDIRPVPTLILSLNALHRSSTYWNEFEAIEGNTYQLPSGIPIRDVTGTFHTKTPAFTDISLSVQKWFWNRQLSGQFAVHNLLNNELRMHPLGGDLNTKFDIKIKLNF